MSQRGFAPILIILLVVSAVFLVGLAVAVNYLWYFDRNDVIEISLPTTQVTPTPATSESTSSADMSNWKTYTNTTFRFKIQYPDNWIVNEPTLQYLDNSDGTQLPVGGVTFKSPDAKIVVNMIGNFQGGWCDSGECISSDFVTNSGLKSKKSVGHGTVYYYFEDGSKNLFINTSEINQNIAEDMAKTLEFLP